MAKALLQDLNVIRDNLVFNHEVTSLSLVLRCIKVIMEEADELRRNPNLFESDVAHREFCNAVGDSLAAIKRVLELWNRDQQLRHELLAEQEDKRQSETRSSYVSGLTPWDQFLRKGAPGVPDVILPRQTVQVVPPTGSAILGHWSELDRALKPRVLPVCLHYSPRRESAWTY